MATSTEELQDSHLEHSHPKLPLPRKPGHPTRSLPATPGALLPASPDPKAKRGSVIVNSNLTDNPKNKSDDKPNNKPEKTKIGHLSPKTKAFLRSPLLEPYLNGVKFDNDTTTINTDNIAIPLFHAIYRGEFDIANELANCKNIDIASMAIGEGTPIQDTDLEKRNKVWLPGNDAFQLALSMFNHLDTQLVQEENNYKNASNKLRELDYQLHDVWGCTQHNYPPDPMAGCCRATDSKTGKVSLDRFGYWGCGCCIIDGLWYTLIRPCLVSCCDCCGSGACATCRRYGTSIKVEESDTRIAALEKDSASCLNLIETLIKKLPGLNPDFKKSNFLQLAKKSGSRMVLTLLKNGVDLETCDSDGNTALIIAASNLDFEMVRLLLSCNANPLARNKKGLTAKEVAIDAIKKLKDSATDIPCYEKICNLIAVLMIYYDNNRIYDELPTQTINSKKVSFTTQLYWTANFKDLIKYIPEFYKFPMKPYSTNYEQQQEYNQHAEEMFSDKMSTYRPQKFITLLNLEWAELMRASSTSAETKPKSGGPFPTDSTRAWAKPEVLAFAKALDEKRKKLLAEKPAEEAAVSDAAQLDPNTVKTATEVKTTKEVIATLTTSEAFLSGRIATLDKTPSNNTSVQLNAAPQAEEMGDEDELLQATILDSLQMPNAANALNSALGERKVKGEQQQILSFSQSALSLSSSASSSSLGRSTEQKAQRLVHLAAVEARLAQTSSAQTGVSSSISDLSTASPAVPTTGTSTSSSLSLAL